mmetsp:Transcript_20260/g.48007  ORF Transcript_20260/g.48007 Transcript_20260/m.48007 type:complete len:212 (+) Transcript_20260:71-706(+)
MDEESDKWELLQARRRRKQQQSARDALQREEERKLVQEYLAYLQQKKFQQQQQRQQLLCRVRAKPQTAEKAEKEEEKPPPKEPIVPAVREIPRVRLPRPRQAQKELPENVATLYGKFKGPLMLKYLKELEASDKVTAWRLNEILSLPNEAECESERTDRDKGQRWSQHLARKQRLRLMHQVATEVLKGKKEMSNCFQDAPFAAHTRLPTFE